jgi:hypothetical protein
MPASLLLTVYADIVPQQMSLTASDRDVKLKDARRHICCEFLQLYCILLTIAIVTVHR